MQSWQPHICGTHLQSRSDNDDGNDDNNKEQKNTYLKFKIKHVFTSKKQNMRLTNCNFFSLPPLPTDTFQQPNQNQEETKKKKTVASNFNNSQ